MKFRRKKVVKQRGSKTHGWGSMKKHRGAGNRGGRGMAGTGKRADTKKPTIINEYGNKYFGKKGFTKHNKKEKRVITLKQVQYMIEKGEIQKKGSFYTAELKKLGYDKLLGSGIINDKVEITVSRASERAIEKVKKAGGKIIITESETSEAVPDTETQSKEQ